MFLHPDAMTSTGRPDFSAALTLKVVLDTGVAAFIAGHAARKDPAVLFARL